MKGGKLNLGCGIKKKEGFINIDINCNFNPDLVTDLNNLFYPFKDDSVDDVYVAQALEHLKIHLIDFLKEIYRILKPEGVLEIIFPNMFSARNRIRYLFGAITSSPEWSPHHIKLVHPKYLMGLLRHIGFDAKIFHNNLIRFPFDYLFTASISIRARKRN